MVGALADGIDARIVGLQGVVHQDAVVARQAGQLGQFGVGFDAGRHHHQVGGDHLAAGQLDGTDTTVAVVDQLFGGGAEAEADSASLQGP
ncbi:hypothetical protein D3C71_1778930 [compost metagenome]